MTLLVRSRQRDYHRDYMRDYRRRQSLASFKADPEDPAPLLEASGEVLSAGLPGPRPNPETLLERRARAEAPYRGLTGVLMGDPPVGYSALDKADEDFASLLLTAEGAIRRNQSSRKNITLFTLEHLARDLVNAGESECEE